MATLPRSPQNPNDFPSLPRVDHALQCAHQLRKLYQLYERAKRDLRDTHRDLTTSGGLTDEITQIRELYARNLRRCEQLLSSTLPAELDDYLWQARVAVAEEKKMAERVQREMRSLRHKRTNTSSHPTAIAGD